MSGPAGPPPVGWEPAAAAAAGGASVSCREVVAAAIVDDLHHPTRLLAAQRTEPPHLAGGWELAGGKIEPGESAVQALHRELAEELGVAVELGPTVDGPHAGWWPLGGPWRMRVWLATIRAGRPRPLQDHGQLRWVSAQDPFGVDWLASNRPIVQHLHATLFPGAGRNPQRSDPEQWNPQHTPPATGEDGRDPST